MPKVSVIMPVYNVEKYLRECLDSVINQTLEDIEIICVDDGSPDNCGEIIDEYASRDSRIVAIHKENGGYGSAINTGIEISKGQYIGIVETDDIIDKTMFEKLYNHAMHFDLDICKCGFNTYDSTKKADEQIKEWKSLTQNIEVFPKDRAFLLREYPALMDYHASIWSNIYKRSFLIKHNIKVNSTRSASYQDYPFMVENMIKAEKIGVVPEYLYNWRREFGQDSSTVRHDKRLMIMAEQCENVKEIIKNANLYGELKEYMYHHFYFCCYSFYVAIDFKYKKEFFDKLHSLFYELKNDKEFEYRLFTRKEKRFVDECINNRFISLTLLKSIKKHIFRLKISKKECYFVIFGHCIWRKK